MSGQFLDTSPVHPGSHVMVTLPRQPRGWRKDRTHFRLLVLTDGSKDEAGEDVWLLVSGASLFWFKYQWE